MAGRPGRASAARGCEPEAAGQGATGGTRDSATARVSAAPYAGSSRDARDAADGRCGRTRPRTRMTEPLMAQKSWTSGLPQEKAGRVGEQLARRTAPGPGGLSGFKTIPRCASAAAPRSIRACGSSPSWGVRMPRADRYRPGSRARSSGRRTSWARRVPEWSRRSRQLRMPRRSGRPRPFTGAAAVQGRRTRHRSPKAALPVSVGPGLPSPQPPPPALLSGVPATGRTMGSRSRRPADAVRARTHRPRAPGPFCPVVLPRCRTLGGEPWAAERPKRRFIPTCAIWYASRGRVSLIPTVDFPSITQLERSCGLTCRG